MENHRCVKNARSLRFSPFEVSNLETREHMVENFRCMKNARSLRFSPLEVSNLEIRENMVEHLRCAKNARSSVLSPRGLQGVSSVRTFFNALGSLEEDLVYNWTCRRKTLAKRRKPALRGKERHAVESP